MPVGKHNSTPRGRENAYSKLLWLSREMTAFLLIRLKLLQLKNLQVEFWGMHRTGQPVNLVSSMRASSSFGGKAASRSKRLVVSIKANVKGTTAPTDTPPASHAH